MRNRGCRSSTTVPVALLAVTACPGSQPQDGDFGSTSDGAEAADTDGGPHPAGECLIEPVDDRYAYKYQCAGDIAIDVQMAGDVIGHPFTRSAFLELRFGHGVEGDSYEQPHVMACCPPYDYSAPQCEQDHKRACVADMIDQACRSLPTKLEDYAHDELAGLANIAKRNSVLRVADHVRKHQQDCIDSFWDDTDIDSTTSTCDEENNGVPFEEMLEEGLWAFNPPGFVDDVEVSVQAATWTGLYPEDSPVVCSSMEENNGVLFVQTDPAPGSKRFRVASGSGVALHGPALDGEPIEGFAELSAVSSLALRTGPAIREASLESLELLAAEAGQVRAVGEETVAVDGLRIRLWDRVLATLDDARETLTIAPGDARFAVSATIFGASSVVTATNETAIVLTRNGVGWSSAAFAIAYEEWGDQWSLVIPPTQWQ
jgi:hypothetical protein